MTTRFSVQSVIADPLRWLRLRASGHARATAPAKPTNLVQLALALRKARVDPDEY